MMVRLVYPMRYYLQFYAFCIMGIREPTSSQTEFFDACRRGDIEKIKTYITNKKSKRPRTPLNFLRPAVPSSGWLASSKDPSTHYTPLHYAALHGHHDVCKFLIESDKLLSSAKDKRGCLPLHLASWNGHQEVVKLLSESHPPSVDAVNNAQESPLHLAAQHGHDKLVRILLEVEN
ncbi:ankyrin repeat protein [Necator americanus]|uniref:Ankyrin repeat protein n=1 Tax=Necator americanus TaxID=51031 RepID=W2TFN5_NECAM|nr:ankyrin repeat protein [Necator americanus]ETN79812.1 ankyrin repeat protein [Necator americanus]